MKSENKASRHFGKLRSSGIRRKKAGLIVSGLVFVAVTLWFLVQSEVLILRLPRLHFSDWQTYAETGGTSLVPLSEETVLPSGGNVEKAEQNTPSAPADAVDWLRSLLALRGSDSPAKTLQNEEEALTRLVRTLLMYFLTAMGILVVRLLYENTDGEFFSSIIGILAAVVLSGELLNLVLDYFVHSAYGSILERLLFASSLISFSFLVYYTIGFYPMSARMLLRSMRRKLLFSEISDIDWVSEGVYYPVDVVTLNSIPQDTEHINGAHICDMSHALRSFVRKASAGQAKRRLILIGGFGAGKSTALLDTVQRRQTGFLHTGSIPVYVKLRDWLKDDKQLENIMNNGANALHNNSLEIYMDSLFEKVTAVGKNNKANEVMKDVFTKLHESRRLVYVYDGMNELLQRRNDGDDDMKNQQRIRNIMSFLYSFAGGNPCIVSMCDLRNVITTRSVMLGEHDQYLVYAVKGVHLDKKRFDLLYGEQSCDRWKIKLLPHVALYRLAEASTKESNSSKTVYSLLKDYVTRQLESELIDDNEVKKCLEAIRATIAGNICEKDPSSFLHTPYIGLKVEKSNQELFRHMGNTRLFYTESVQQADALTGSENQKNESEPETKYHPSHILIYEYMLADYFMYSLDNKSDKDKDQFITLFFCGKENEQHLPDILELPHLRAVFKMVIEEMLTSNTNKKDQAKDACTKIFEWICSKKPSDASKEPSDTSKESSDASISLVFLHLLSEINDDLHKLNSDKNGIEEWFISNNKGNNMYDKLAGLIDSNEIPVALKVALLRLLPGKNAIISSIIAKDLLQKRSSHLSLQRELLLYTGLDLNEPISNGQQNP